MNDPSDENDRFKRLKNDDDKWTSDLHESMRQIGAKIRSLPKTYLETYTVSVNGRKVSFTDERDADAVFLKIIERGPYEPTMTKAGRWV